MRSSNSDSMSSVAQVAEMWRQVHRQAHDLFRNAFKDFDLPHLSWLLLKRIHADPGVTVSDLARRLGTAKSHVSNIAEQLVQEDLVEKRLDEHDRRLLRLYTTETSNEVMQNLSAKATENWEIVRGHMTESEWDNVERALSTLLRALKKTNASLEASAHD